ncbi:MAG: hypothetical protein AAF329_06405 [Cyanobacteria bacterium P01_A01_bin.17]
MTKIKETKIDLSEDETLDEEVLNEDAPLPVQIDDEIDVDEDLDELDQLPKRAVRNMDGSVTLPLEFPVALKTRKGGKVRERKFNELVMHRMNGSDFRTINAAAEEHQSIVALARSARLNQAVTNALYDRMVDVDIANAGRVMNHFLASGPRGGQRS